MSSAPRSFLSTGSRQVDEWENLGTAICICAMSGFGALAATGASADWRMLLEIAMALVLACCCCVVWSTNRIWDVPSRSLRRSLALWLARLQDLVSPGGHAEARVMSHRAASNGLVVAVEAMARSEAPLTFEIANGAAATAAVHEGTNELSYRIETLAGEVRANTQRVSTMLMAATDAAREASKAQEAIAGLCAMALNIAGTCGELRNIMLAASPAHGVLLSAFLAKLEDFSRSAEVAIPTTEHLVLSGFAQCEAGEELLRLLSLQTQTTGALRDQVAAFGTQCDAARRSIEAIDRLHRTSREASTTVWRAVEQFPGRAETIARLLRELPDFKPKARTQGI